MNVYFTNQNPEVNCWVRLSDASMKTDGLLLIEHVKTDAYCLNPGYYLIGCESASSMRVKYPGIPGPKDEVYDVVHDLTEAPYYKVLSLNQIQVSWTTVPENHKKPDFWHLHIISDY